MRDDTSLSMFTDDRQPAIAPRARLPGTGLLLPVALGLLLAAAQTGAADIVISEIMFHPLQPVEGPEPVAEEFIELLNRGTNPVSLAGWQLTRGVDFTFTNAALAPGARLVVAADRTTFLAKYPGVTNVLGNWTGALRNRGEEIRLDNAAGQTESCVRYATEGEWGTRRRGPLSFNSRGWIWHAEHDGLGRSLELINAALPIGLGPNWASSTVADGTPGAANSVAATNIAPLIVEAAHAPLVPRSTDPVTITARVIDEETNGLSVTLFHRNHSTLSPPAFTAAPMFDDGMHGDGGNNDGVFGAVLGPLPAGTVIEFYVSATDAGARTRTWPTPAITAADGAGPSGQVVNALFQVDDGTYAGPQPIYRVVMTESERVELQNIIRDSEAQMNATLVAVDGVGTELRYFGGLRIRGAELGSREATPPPYRLNLPNDRLWNGTDKVNLNSQFTHVQVAAALLAQKAGMVAANARAVELRLNGVDPAFDTPVPGNIQTWQFGSYAAMEPLDDDWADKHLPGDPNGNLYRAAILAHTANLQNITSKAVALTKGYSKNSNASEDDWSDLIGLSTVLSSASSDAVYLAGVQQYINAPMWMRYFALMTLLTSQETALATGRGDDYSMYRGVVDPRFLLLPHDLDTTLGEGDSGTYVQSDLFLMINPPNTSANVPVLNRFMTNANFVPLYYGELLRMLDTTFAPAEFGAILDHALGDWVPVTVLDRIKTFQLQRNAYVRSQIQLDLTVTNLLPLSSGYPRTTAATVTLGGRGNAIDTRSVRVNGQPATWLAQPARWFLSGIPLRPGVNRILVQSFGTNGAEIARTTTEVWYDDATVANVSGTLPLNTNWTAAAGPYNATANVIVPAGGTLTIEPGTSVYFASAANLIVQGTLNATGAETQRIRFGRAPAVSAAWPGLLFGTASTGRLAHVHFDGAGVTGASLRASNATVFLSHATWSNTLRTLVAATNSSLDLRQCVLPAIATNDVLTGGPIPPGGFFIVESNYFGGTTSTNDVIDFSGAQRPGPVLQVLNNTFAAATDDALDLDGADAHVEGNQFLHVRKNNAAAGDSANAIAFGRDAGYAPHVVAVRNLFFDVDHAALCKEGGALTFVNNTVVGSAIAALNFSEPERNTLPGALAIVDGNIFFNPPGYTGTNFQNRLPTNGTVQLTLRRNLLASLDGMTNGLDGNLVTDPRLRNTDTNTITADTLRSDFALLPGSPGLGTGPNGLDRGALVPAGASISGEPPPLTGQGSATLIVGGPGISNYIFRVNGGAYSSERPVSMPIELSGLGNGAYTVQVLGRNSAGVLQSAPVSSRSWTVNTALAAVRLNEVLAANRTTLELNGETPDLVELRNPGAVAASLAGMGLTDDPLDKYKFTFPPGTMLGPTQYLVLYADTEASPGLHLGFGLDQNSDALFLYASPAQGGGLVDSVAFGPQVEDHSVGRLADGAWGLTLPTFGAANVPAVTGDPRRVLLNEWLAKALATYPGDFIELHNSDTLPVSLAGYFLTDEPAGAPTRHAIAPLSFVPAGGHVVFRPDSDTNAGLHHLDFKLSPVQGILALVAPDRAVQDCVYYGPQFTDVSEGRRPSGAGTIAALEVPTPGAANPGMAGSSSVTNEIVNLVPFGATWRYNQTANLDATAWKGTNYNDGAWPSGPALLAVESCQCLPPPGIQTTLTLGRTTYYFRHRFVVNSNLAAFTIHASMLADDGVVIYLNSNELTRVLMPPGPVVYATFAVDTPDVEGVVESFTFPGNLLRQGTNVLAVEVHQVDGTSSDIVWGLGLTAIRPVTNTTPRAVALNEILASNASITNEDGSITDWVELFNPTGTNVLLADMSLSDSISTPRQWVFPDGVVLGPGARLVVRCDPDSPASTNNGPVLNTGFGLDNDGDDVLLFDAPARGGALVDSVTFGLQASDFSIGRVPDGAAEWRLTRATRGGVNLAAGLGSATPLRLNEWLADPKPGDDDWFELYNPGAQPVALGGFFLTDKLSNRTRHQIAPLSFIGTVTNGYARFIADENLSAGGNHVNFRLDGDGEAIGLFPPGTGPVVDAVVFDLQESGVSEGRFPDGAASIVRFPESVSPAEPNYLPLRHVALHEALSHTDAPFEDAIELRNLSAATVDIGGWFVSDSNNDFKKFRVPDGSMLGPEGFVVFYENQFNPTPGRGKSFALSSAGGETLHLSMADAAGNLLGYRAQVKFGAASNAVSFGRYETSTGPDFPALLARSFGQDEPASVAQFRLGTGGVNAAPRVGPVIISEIMYRPPDLDGTNDNVGAEFIELLNLSTNTVPLHDPARPTNTWRLRDAVSFNFPPGTNLSAGGRLLVVSFDPANAALLGAFRTNYTVAAQVPVFGPYNGKLDNSSDSVELLRPDAPQTNGAVPYVLVERVKYFDSTPWPSLADGHTNGPGLSLQRRGNADYGNDPVNWQAGLPTAGAATGLAALTLPAVTLHPVSTLLTNGSTVTFAAGATGAAPLSWQWRFNGHPIAGATNATLVLSNARLAHAGRYAALVSNPAGAATTIQAKLAAQLPPAPALIEAARLPGSAFQFELTGEPGWRYAIERVSTLGSNWVQFVLVTNLTGRVTITDSTAISVGQRFYRGRVEP